MSAHSHDHLIESDPYAGVITMTAERFLSYNFPLYGKQRECNPKHVERILYEQASAAGKPLFVGAMVVAHLRGKYYLMDGQHRTEALKELAREGLGSTFTVNVCSYVCGSDVKLADRIYEQCNFAYTANGTIDRKTGHVYDQFEDAKLIAERIRKLYPLQFGGSKAPNFDTNHLITEINKSGILSRMSVDDIVQKIKEYNGVYAKVLKRTKPMAYDKCKSGFYLPYKDPKCRWVSKVFSVQ